MSTRHIQTVVSDEDHWKFTVFASSLKITLGDLVALAVREYIQTREKEERENASQITIKQAEASGGSSL